MARSVAKVAWVFLVSAVGCGYRFVPRGSELPEGVKSVCAPVFVNETPEPALEVLFTEAFRQELVRAGNLAKGECEARVEGAVVGLGSAPTIIAGSYRASATVRLRLVKEGRLLRETYVSGSEDFLTRTGDVLEVEANRQAALHRLVETLMREGYERLASG
jgi:hypothetical protein